LGDIGGSPGAGWTRREAKKFKPKVNPSKDASSMQKKRCGAFDGGRN